MNEYLKELPDLDSKQTDVAQKWIRSFYEGAPIFIDMIEPDVLTYIFKVVLRDLDQNKAIDKLLKE